MRPIIKWAGGKSKLAVQVAELLGPISGTYFEPFLGGAAVFLHLRSQGFEGKAVLADTNARLINMYEILRADCAGLLDELHELPKDDWRERYYDMRDRFNGTPFKAESAALFLWLNRHCFNGLYRENKAGKFNVPIGKYKTINFPSEERFYEVSEALQGTIILHASFDTVIGIAGPNDVVYCDPPYVPLNVTAKFTNYTKDGFSFDDQKALTAEASAAAQRGARVVLSNHDLPVVREMYSEFEITSLKAKRSISRKGSSRKPVGEVLAVAG